MAADIDTETTAATASGIALKYMRYHSPDWMPCDTIEDAVAQAYWMREDGSAWPTEVVSLDGTVLLDEATLDERVDAYDKAQPSEPLITTPEIAEIDGPAAAAFSRFMGRSSASRSDWHQLPEDMKAVWRDKAKGSAA